MKKGKITQMGVWIDSSPTQKWQPYESKFEIPVSEWAHVRFRDEYGNESTVLSDTTNPPDGPPPESQ